MQLYEQEKSDNEKLRKEVDKLRQELNETKLDLEKAKLKNETKSYDSRIDSRVGHQVRRRFYLSPVAAPAAAALLYRAVLLYSMLFSIHT